MRSLSSEIAASFFAVGITLPKKNKALHPHRRNAKEGAQRSYHVLGSRVAPLTPYGELRSSEPSVIITKTAAFRQGATNVAAYNGPDAVSPISPRTAPCRQRALCHRAADQPPAH